MSLIDPDEVFDAERFARERAMLPTNLDTAQLRKLGAKVLARSVFVAHGTNVVFLTKLKEVIEKLTSGKIGEGQARTALWEVLKAIGYTPEGGFPDAKLGEVPPAVRGSIQDLSSPARRNLIIETQLNLATGAGMKYRGENGILLEAYPAWELIRAVNVEKLRNWPARWTLVGGVPPGPRYDAGAYKVPGASTGMYALKGDPLWEKLGSYAFFSDALGVDHPPFCFNSEMTWRPVKLAKALEEGITGPAGESIKQWLANLKGTAEEFQTPQLSTSGMDEGMKQALEDLTGITENEDALRYKDILAREIEASKSAYQRRNPDFNPDLQFKDGRWQ